MNINTYGGLIGWVTSIAMTFGVASVAIITISWRQTIGDPFWLLGLFVWLMGLLGILAFALLLTAARNTAYVWAYLPVFIGAFVIAHKMKIVRLI